MVSRTDPSGTVSYIYDDAGRLEQLNSDVFGSFDLCYDNASRMTSVSYLSGVDLALSRDARGRVSAMDYLQAGLVVESESRVLDLVGNPLSKSRAGTK